VPSEESNGSRDLADVVKYNLPLNNSEGTNKLLPNDHSASILSTKVIIYLESVLDEKNLDRNTCVCEYINKLIRLCLLCDWM
jgi:hypothetical protein